MVAAVESCTGAAEREPLAVRLAAVSSCRLSGPAHGLTRQAGCSVLPLSKRFDLRATSDVGGDAAVLPPGHANCCVHVTSLRFARDLGRGRQRRGTARTAERRTLPVGLATPNT